MYMSEKEIGVRTIRLSVTVGDVASLIGDSRDPTVHTALLTHLVRMVDTWEELDFDWHSHVSTALARMQQNDKDSLRTILQVLTQELRDAT